ncbi:hypothetical protein GCM10028824_23870 [Hymenobacter segetis]|uniref:Uncharacterized protein n=1 Tax=Hymenobacter segetis TaxID=2025509 RepID=A0ABU9LXS6_9BACT
MSILSIIGLVAVVIFGKFIWDTYITGKTENDAKANEKRNPEEATRMELNVKRGQHLNFDYSPKRNADNRKKSLNILVELIGCEASDIEKIYKATLAKEIIDIHANPISFLKTRIEDLRKLKTRDALSMNFDPDDTPAAFMCEWAVEMLESTIRQKEKIELEIFVDDERERIRQEMRRISIATIAENLDCEEKYAELCFKQQIKNDATVGMIENGIDILDFLNHAKSTFEETKESQAIELGISEDVTPAGIACLWLNDLIIERQNRTPYDDYVENMGV